MESLLCELSSLRDDWATERPHISPWVIHRRAAYNREWLESGQSVRSGSLSEPRVHPQGQARWSVFPFRRSLAPHEMELSSTVVTPAQELHFQTSAVPQDSKSTHTRANGPPSNSDVPSVFVISFSKASGHPCGNVQSVPPAQTVSQSRWLRAPQPRHSPSLVLYPLARYCFVCVG